MGTATCAALVVVSVAGFVMFRVGLGHAASLTGQLYPFTLPYVYQSIASCVVAVLGLLLRKHRALCLAVSSGMLSFLIAPFFYAIERWPGGDDGGLFAWTFYVGIGSAICFFVGGMTLGLAVVILVLKKPSQDQEP